MLRVVLRDPTRLPPLVRERVEVVRGSPDDQDVVDMVTAQNQGIYDAAPRTPQFTGPTSFRGWCENALKPAILASGKATS